MVLSALLAGAPAMAAEGMWTLDNPPLKAMQKDLGWAPSQAWIDKAMHGAVRLANGCSGSFVSKNGLVLTNHHCVAECLEQLSTASSDLLSTGFHARGNDEEQQCPAMEIDRLDRITDVTADVAAASQGLEGTAFKTAQNAVKARLAAACVGNEGARLRCDVVDLYHGGQFKLYRYRRFQDVRIVFAPEEAIADFGGDPDNFNFPRDDLDMALVRVYDAGKPLPVRDFFAMSRTGPAAGEAVFTVGHPGTTQRGLTVAQLALLRDDILIARALRQAEYRGLLTEYRTRGGEAARTAAGELFFLENSYKVVQGELAALHDPALFEQKRAEEAALRSFVASRPELAATTGGAWDAIAAAEKTHRDLLPVRTQLSRGETIGGDYLAFARTLVVGAAERAKRNDSRLPEFNDSRLPQVEASLFSPAPVHPALEQLKITFGMTQLRERLGADAPLVRRVLGKESPEQIAARLVAGTTLGDPAVRRRLWEGGAAAIAASDDPMIRLAVAIDPEVRAVNARYERDVETVIQRNTELIAKARFAMLGEGLYPDATFTLRLSYGVVAGWTEAGAAVPPFTRLGGAFDRATGADPFRLPPSWLAAKSRLDLGVPFNLSSDNDVVGGNSGSPMLNRQGELVGLVFDGNIQSLGGAFGFDPALNRTVSVDSAAMLEALDKIYGAKALAAELRNE